MASSLRELRQRRSSVAATMKITRAMELIAASRVTKAQQRARKSEPFNEELVRAVSAVARHTEEDHPLTVESANPTRAAVLVVSSDRGLAGAYSVNVIKTAEGLMDKLRAEGKEVDLYTSGRKAADYFGFRDVAVVRSWQGFSESPTYADVKEIGDALINTFLADVSDGGVDELHVVFTRFRSLVSQQTQIVRLLPLEFVEGDSDGDGVADSRGSRWEADFAFEPSAEAVLDQLLPMYIRSRIRFALTEAAASELAARQQAMHSATDNAKQLIDSLTRDANQARQAEITQEINEIVGGAGALTGAE